jgi:hypothetical protein
LHVDHVHIWLIRVQVNVHICIACMHMIGTDRCTVTSPDPSCLLGWGPLLAAIAFSFLKLTRFQNGPNRNYLSKSKISNNTKMWVRYKFAFGSFSFLVSAISISNQWQN